VDHWPNDQFVLSWGVMVAERLQEPVSRTKFLSRYLAVVDAPVERVALIRALLEQQNLAGQRNSSGSYSRFPRVMQKDCC